MRRVADINKLRHLVGTGRIWLHDVWVLSQKSGLGSACVLGYASRLRGASE